MGKSSSEKLSRLMTSLHGPVETSLGKNLPISASMGSILILSSSPCGDFTSMKYLIRSAISSSESTSSAMLHAALGAELVDQQLRAGIAFDVFEQQRRAARTVLAARSPLGDAVGDLGDLQDRIGFRLDALQFSRLVERGDPFPQVVIGQANLASVVAAAKPPSHCRWFRIRVTDDYSGRPHEVPDG